MKFGLVLQLINLSPNKSDLHNTLKLNLVCFCKILINFLFGQLLAICYEFFKNNPESELEMNKVF